MTMAGRPKKRQCKDTLVAFRMDADTHEFVALLSEHFGIYKSEIIRLAIRAMRSRLYRYLAKTRDAAKE